MQGVGVKLAVDIPAVEVHAVPLFDDVGLVGAFENGVDGLAQEGPDAVDGIDLQVFAVLAFESDDAGRLEERGDGDGLGVARGGVAIVGNRINQRLRQIVAVNQFHIKIPIYVEDCRPW